MRQSPLDVSLAAVNVCLLLSLAQPVLKAEIFFSHFHLIRYDSFSLQFFIFIFSKCLSFFYVYVSFVIFLLSN